MNTLSLFTVVPSHCHGPAIIVMFVKLTPSIGPGPPVAVVFQPTSSPAG
eukprot:COSAG02_NODE_58687_length_276_cov_1.152542_1_plen_48_part_01